MLSHQGILVLPSHRPKKKIKKVLKKCKKCKSASKRTWAFSVFEGRCHYCGQKLVDWQEAAIKNHPLPKNRIPTLDHKVPRIKGGESNLENLILACMECNGLKSGKDYEEFVEESKRNHQC